jgi:hypothetical protein
MKMGDAKPVNSPMEPGMINILRPNPERATPNDISYYRQGIGSLNYLTTMTRPDISFAVSKLSQYLTNPSKHHIGALNQILRYLKGTSDLRLVYEGEDIRITGYADADFAGDVDTRRSVSAFVFTVGSTAVGWQSQRQRTVATSTTEAEYISLFYAVLEAVWLQRLLLELNQPIYVIPMMEDNQAALHLAKNTEFHKRTKHIDIKYHYTREVLERGLITLTYFNTKKMIADGLTKPLLGTGHRRMLQQLGMEA